MFRKHWLAGIALAGMLANSAGLAAEEKTAWSELQGFIDGQVERHPDIQAAREAARAARARRRAAAQPLYNPALELEAERDAENNTNLGIGARQTIDWRDKRGARARVAQNRVAAAEAALVVAEQDFAVKVLRALVDYRVAVSLAELGRERVAVLERFAALAEERQRAGDISQADSDLAYLAHAEALSARAEADLAVNDALQTLRLVVGRVPAALPELPAALPPVLRPGDLKRLAQQHPQVQALRLNYLAAQAEVEVARSERHADPTLGAGIMQEGDEEVVGLTLSLPLHVRNDYSAEAAAVAAEATVQQARLQAEQRRVLAYLETALASYEASHHAYEEWATVVGGRLDEGEQLLERLWRVGELSAPEYLLQLRQRLDARAAGLRLRGQVWKTWMNWFEARGDWRALMRDANDED